MKRPITMLLLILGLAGLSIPALAQVEDYNQKDRNRNDRTSTSSDFEYNSSNDGKKWDWSRARIGGNLGMAFGSSGIMIDASPTFGYLLNRVVELGAGYKIFYYKYDDLYAYDRNGNLYQIFYKDFIHGPIGYGRFTVWNGIFVMGQYEMANKDPYYPDNPNDRINVHHLLLGGGYSSAIGSAGQINISLLYNVLDQKESIYQFGTFGDFPLLLNISVGFGISGGRR